MPPLEAVEYQVQFLQMMKWANPDPVPGFTVVDVYCLHGRLDAPQRELGSHGVSLFALAKGSDLHNVGPRAAHWLAFRSILDLLTFARRENLHRML